MKKLSRQETLDTLQALVARPSGKEVLGLQKHTIGNIRQGTSTRQSSQTATCGSIKPMAQSELICSALSDPVLLLQKIAGPGQCRFSIMSPMICTEMPMSEQFSGSFCCNAVDVVPHEMYYLRKVLDLPARYILRIPYQTPKLCGSNMRSGSVSRKAQLPKVKV